LLEITWLHHDGQTSVSKKTFSFAPIYLKLVNAFGTGKKLDEGQMERPHRAI
jgi:hypothetical protein